MVAQSMQLYSAVGDLCEEGETLKRIHERF